MADEAVPQKRFHHVSVCLDNNILVFGGLWSQKPLSYHTIWMFNLYTEQWSKHVIPETELAPNNIVCACAVAIGDDVHMFGGVGASNEKTNNALWTLKRTSAMCFVWRKIVTKNNIKAPSPRSSHGGWEYAGNLWVFGGFGPSLVGYLNDSGDYVGGWNNQLLSFNPSRQLWTNLKSSGAVPSPRAGHATTTGRNKAWCYGGYDGGTVFDELYELKMSSLIWTHIQTRHPKPKGCYASTLSSISGNKNFILHGGADTDNIALNDTWILDIPSWTWKQYKSNTGHCRCGHSSTVGINGCTIIICGTKDCNQHFNDYSTSFLILLEPRSLQQLAMQMILKHRAETAMAVLSQEAYYTTRHL